MHAGASRAAGGCQRGGTAYRDVFVTADGRKGRMIPTDSGVAGVRTFEQ
jgi:hypothetical protein